MEMRDMQHLFREMGHLPRDMQHLRRDMHLPPPPLVKYHEKIFHCRETWDGDAG